jgi:hypothetical protein
MGGSAMTTKVIGKDGKEKWVRLTGAEKAMVCRILSNFGIHEEKVVDLEPQPRKAKKGKVISEMVEKLSPHLEDRPAVMPPDKFQALMCHCCEAAEIVFEDI